MYKLGQLKRESDKENVYYNLSIDSIGWYMKNYHTDKILRDLLYNIAKKVYLLGNENYIQKFNALPDKLEVEPKNNELEKLFSLAEKRVNK